MQLMKAKKKYGSLYRIEFDDVLIIFRIMKWGEFKAYRDMFFGVPEREEYIYDDIFSSCVIDTNLPHEYDEEEECMNVEDSIMPAGITKTLGSAIMRLSGAMDADQIFRDIETVRSYAFMDPEQRITGILSTIMKYNQIDLDNMYWDDIVKTIGQLELVMQGATPTAPFAPAPMDDGKIDFDKENREDGDV